MATSFTRVTGSSNTATAVLASQAEWRGALIQNAGTATAYFGADATVDSTGYPLAAGSTVAPGELVGPVYAICPTASLDLRIWGGFFA